MLSFKSLSVRKLDFKSNLDVNLHFSAYVVTLNKTLKTILK